jgi:hypothetical protein
MAGSVDITGRQHYVPGIGHSATEVVAVANNEPTLVVYDPTTQSLVSGDGISFLRGPIVSGTWMTQPSIFRLRITGTGTLQMDSRDSLGNITLATFPSTSYTGETDKIEFPYAGDDAVAIRVTLTGTLTCEVI